jgi:hypothetical protein
MTDSAVNVDELPAGYKSMVGEMGLSEDDLEQVLYQSINQQYQAHIAQQDQQSAGAPDMEAADDAE